MLRTIQLHGVLGERFGKHFELDVESPKEACIALSYQVEGFRKFMKTAHQSGLFFAVFNDDNNIGANEIEANTGASVIRIVPKIVGSGGDTLGILQVVAGAVLIGVGVFAAGLTGGTSTALISAGVGLMVGGTATLLMPTPNLDPQDPSGNKPSYGYGGAQTTVAPGNCVPLLYGRRLAGAHWLGGLSVSEDTKH